MSTNMWYGQVQEDGTFSVLSRITALSGTGTTVRDIEGPCVKKADVASITCKVYSLGTNRNNQAGVALSPDPTVTINDSIFDTLQTSGWPTTEDRAGYNFRFDVGATYVPNGNEWYLIEFKITLASGAIVWLKLKVKTSSGQTS